MRPIGQRIDIFELTKEIGLLNHERGDVLTADCAEQSRGGRSGLYDTRVTDQNGRLIALFRGRSATIRGRFIEETPT